MKTLYDKLISAGQSDAQIGYTLAEERCPYLDAVSILTQSQAQWFTYYVAKMNPDQSWFDAQIEELLATMGPEWQDLGLKKYTVEHIRAWIMIHPHYIGKTLDDIKAMSMAQYTASAEAKAAGNSDRATKKLESVQRDAEIDAANAAWREGVKARNTNAEYWKEQSKMLYERHLNESRAFREARDASMTQWADWVQHLRSIFKGLKNQ